MATFEPELNGWVLQRGFPTAHRENVIEDQSELGTVRSVAVSERVAREWTLTYRTDSRSSRDYITDFYRRHVGAAGRFDFLLPDFVPSPVSAGPTVSLTSSGSQSQRVITVSHTWKTSAGETLPSPTSTITVLANNLLVVTLPPYPPNVDESIIYAAQDSAGNEKAQTTLASGVRTWTSPDSALGTSGLVVPSENTAKETANVKFAKASLVVTRNIGTTYEARVSIVEDLF